MMESDPPLDDEMEAVDLDVNALAIAEPQPQQIPKPPTAVADTLADEREAVAAAEPIQQVEESTQTLEALSKLKESSQRLGGAVATTGWALSETFGISSTLTSLSSSVKQIDSEHEISSNLAGIGSWFSTSLKMADDQYKISETAGGIVEALVPAEDRKATTKALQEFEDTHGIVKSTASTLSAGADLLTSSIWVDEKTVSAATRNTGATAKLEGTLDIPVTVEEATVSSADKNTAESDKSTAESAESLDEEATASALDVTAQVPKEKSVESAGTD